jgi:DNA (cytosine-5)-methyltransferase 1
MSKLRVLDLFSGIGGFSLGLERTGGFETVAFCEIEPYPRAVLKKHWPEVPCYEDVRTLTADTLARDGIAVDVICGGFPCQDISSAGHMLGMDGERSILWQEVSRLAGELHPQFVILENVSGLLSLGMGDVLRGLAAIGYDAEWHCIPAGHIGASHQRDRIWIIAYPAKGDAASAMPQRIPKITRRISSSIREAGSRSFCSHEGFATVRLNGEPSLCRADDGFSYSLVLNGIMALGNAVVPQIPELIGRAILQAEGLTP